MLRGARQVGKSTAVQELAKRFESFVEINFEKQPQYKALFNEDLNPDDYFYVSETVYLPERYLTNNIEENALQYSITIEDNNYSAPIADGTEAPVDYNIIRNCAYTTIGTYRQEVLSDFNLLVVPWDDEKVIEVPPFE